MDQGETVLQFHLLTGRGLEQMTEGKTFQPRMLQG